jgi:hypothetical protein
MLRASRDKAGDLMYVLLDFQILRSNASAPAALSSKLAAFYCHRLNSLTTGKENLKNA